jgi:hypothetical protein
MLLEVPSPDISSELSFLLGMPAEAGWLAQAADFCSLRSPEGTSALLARDAAGPAKSVALRFNGNQTSLSMLKRDESLR